jgi:pimeloyl-ACP methyl ester carboxylesterase
VVWYFQLTSDLTTVARYESPNFSTRAKQRAEARTAIAENGLRLSIGSDRRSGWNKFRYGLTYAMTLPFKFVTGPFIDAFGKSAWDNMTRRTQTMFRSPGDFKRPNTTNEIEVAKQRVASPAGGAVARLMQSLDNLMTNSLDHYSITLVGHSMGTIVANEIIRTHPDLPYSNVVYMGAACSISDFAKSVVPYLQSRTNAHFYNLTLHPVAEAREAQWGFLDLTPRGSLLEWIDNFLSAPRTIPERTLGKWNNIISTTALIPREVEDRIRIKAFAVGSKDRLPKDNPLVHGEFSETEFWNEQFWRRRAP